MFYFLRSNLHARRPVQSARLSDNKLVVCVSVEYLPLSLELRPNAGGPDRSVCSTHLKAARFLYGSLYRRTYGSPPLCHEAFTRSFSGICLQTIHKSHSQPSTGLGSLFPRAFSFLSTPPTPPPGILSPIGTTIPLPFSNLPTRRVR